MQRLLTPLAATIAALALAGCYQSAGSTPRNQAPAARVVGEPVTCIALSQIRSTRVYGDRTIDFDLGGGKVYRNTLPNACPGLGFEEAFSYETSLSQLCNVDIIHVLERGTGQVRPGAACGLGKFTPIELKRR